METAVPIAYCKRQLALIWFIGGGILFAIVLMQTLLERYGSAANQAWGWLLPSVLPTLSLIIGQLVFDAVQGGNRGRTVDRFLFRLTAMLSSVYLLAVLMVILMAPFLRESGPLQLMAESNVWLGPVQGLVSAALGAFFVKAAMEEQGVPAELAAAVEVARLREEARKLREGGAAREG
jgi:hypothetical protein